MKAFVVDRYGRKNGVRAGDMPVPELREDDVLIQIHAAGVNPLDSKIRDGEFKLLLPYRLPLILGHDLAGVVVRVGPHVRRFKPGDEVFARPHKDRIGTFAEFIAVKEDGVALKPTSLSMEEAASMPLVGLTAWQALIEKGQLAKGQKVLIHAGSGGVGTFAIQLAKHVGATVATTASAANAEWLKQLGADVVIDYKKDDFAAILKDYDVVLDTQGGNTLEKSLRVLKPGGKLIGIAGPPDPDFAKEIGASLFLKTAMRFLSYRIRKAAKRHHVSYSFLFMRANGEQLGQIAALVDAGAIKPVIDRVFPFESTNEALAYVERGRVKGKVVVKM
ncbi:NADP-dependent oxidoreductase [Paraburkholderia sp. DD10]|uniref:Alcohol dehydrogenase n=1 Tax=Paraburkholderia terricola TaxID=169427 RepID=A0A1M6NTN7_9BURK|nr:MULTISPECIES: NADP-dependent oxidoreductase [Paraburkholderia]AXE95776.1 NADP-dependent oxidoreductase [Paraburkholderia terricola]ORC51741.1 NADPH:quinone oxidoreductase [Burkholderia sp. A27]SDO18734.1 alcohol dehydrogenase [Paraburkholderia sediminicola]SHJ98972.1 alcohol dehydrogenase [Paraburkholderia terricola]